MWRLCDGTTSSSGGCMSLYLQKCLKTQLNVEQSLTGSARSTPYHEGTRTRRSAPINSRISKREVPACQLLAQRRLIPHLQPAPERTRPDSSLMVSDGTTSCLRVG